MSVEDGIGDVVAQLVRMIFADWLGGKQKGDRTAHSRDLWRYFVFIQFRIFLYDHDQIFKTRINLDILDGFDTIQQQEQDIVLG